MLPPGAVYVPPGKVVKTVVTYDDGTQITIVPDGDGHEQTTCSRRMELRPDGLWQIVRR